MYSPVDQQLFRSIDEFINSSTSTSFRRTENQRRFRVSRRLDERETMVEDS